MPRKLTRRQFIRGLGGLLALAATSEISDLLEPPHLLDVSQFAGKDFGLIYNSGGLGRSPLMTDPEFFTIMSGVRSKLETLGYSVAATEHLRCHPYNIPYAIIEALTSYERTAIELATQIESLTQTNEKLRIILMGECFGARFSNKVMQLSPDNKRLYSIQFGVPFFVAPVRYRTLVVNGIGSESDPINTGDPIGIIGLFSSSLRSSPQNGHFYTWSYPDIQSQVISFLYREVLN